MGGSIASEAREPDQLLREIADYVDAFEIGSSEAYDTARVALMDTLGCGLEALEYPECVKLLGPVVPGVTARHYARVPGTQFELDPVTAAFNIIRTRQSQLGALGHRQLKKDRKRPALMDGLKGFRLHKGPMTVGSMEPTTIAMIHTTTATPSALSQPML